MNFFDSKNLDYLLELHNEPEQIEKQSRALQVNIKVENKKPLIDYEKKTMITTKGKDNQNYEVSLEKCTCEDFRFREVPCKHMYKLAKELGIFVMGNNRSRELIADFSKGYADGWKFIVRPCNYSDLDIDYNNILSEDENSELFLTQGKRYNFKSGEIFFDNICAYKEIWANALKKLNFCLQIDSVTESISAKRIVFENDKFISGFTSVYGIIDFSVYKTNENRTGFEKIGNYSCKQDEFAELLRTGEFADSDGEIHKIC